jgi:hypothetical protein
VEVAPQLLAGPGVVSTDEADVILVARAAVMPDTTLPFTMSGPLVYRTLARVGNGRVPHDFAGAGVERDDVRVGRVE